MTVATLLLCLLSHIPPRARGILPGPVTPVLDVTSVNADPPDVHRSRVFGKKVAPEFDDFSDSQGHGRVREIIVSPPPWFFWDSLGLAVIYEDGFLAPSHGYVSLLARPALNRLVLDLQSSERVVTVGGRFTSGAVNRLEFTTNFGRSVLAGSEGGTPFSITLAPACDLLAFFGAADNDGIRKIGTVCGPAPAPPTTPAIRSLLVGAPNGHWLFDGLGRTRPDAYITSIVLFHLDTHVYYVGLLSGIILTYDDGTEVTHGLIEGSLVRQQFTLQSHERLICMHATFDLGAVCSLQFLTSSGRNSSVYGDECDLSATLPETLLPNDVALALHSFWGFRTANVIASLGVVLVKSNTSSSHVPGGKA